jgi:hypothetical protein
MPKTFTSLLLVIILGFGPSVRAQESLTVDNFNSLPLGDLAMQANWVVTKLDPNSSDLMEVSTSDPTTDDNFIEITNTSSISAVRTQEPKTSGIFEFKTRHNQSGLFYIYAQTSDNGGQLLFSLQFTEDKEILLEQANEQVTLLSNYNKDQWYQFLINFDNTRGDNGSFTVEIDGENYGEYEYVNSESEVFDFAQITIGSDSTGSKAISAFSDITSHPSLDTSTTSSELLSLSISLSSTSISSDLDNGLIVTASLDGIASLATTTILANEASTTPDTGTTSNNLSLDNSSGIVDFVTEIIEDIIDIFVPEEDLPNDTPNDITTEPPLESASSTNMSDADTSASTADMSPSTEVVEPTTEDTSITTTEEVESEPVPVAEPILEEVEASYENITTEF